MNVAKRNELAKQYILGKLDTASNLADSNFKTLKDHKKILNILTKLIFVQAKGFRGVVATAITGMHLNPQYDPINNFYSCNPRSIFEQGIFYAFEERQIPCGKSDPLNVAKNINVLDNEWAKGKRPQGAAQAAVDFLKILVLSQKSERETIINLFFFKLLEYAKSISAIKITLPNENSISNQDFAHKLCQFTLEYPESGTIPQFLISTLLKEIYQDSSIQVKGGEESVFGTNTTSKKPADIWLEKEGNPYNLFEVTVKKIDLKRLDDSIQSLNSVQALSLPVHFICRLNKDISSLPELTNDTLKYKGKTFNFVDICSLIHSISTLFSPEQINNILKDINQFIGQVQRPLTTKNGWNSIFK